MRKIISFFTCQLLAFTCLAQTTLIHNIKGYTLDGKQLKQFSALQFTNDKIDKIYYSNETEISPKTPHTASNIKTIDGHGKTLLPGLIDAHGHVLSYGLSLMRADLTNTTSEQAAVDRVIDYAKNNKGFAWIQGRGWNQVQWQANSKFPDHTKLDKAFPDTPVWLERVDGHAGWANKKAMELAGITSGTKSPDGGQIIKDSAGNPTGIFIDNAMKLIETSIAPLTKQEQKFALIKAMKSLASLGLTSVHDAGITAENIDIYKELTEENNMPIRINAMLYVPSINWLATVNKGTYQSLDAMFALNSIKIQADGALGSRGASLIENYSDKPDHKGLLLHDEETLSNYISTAMNAGFQVNIHAIGDNANNIVLNQYQKLIPATKTKNSRHRIEHAQILTASDIERFSKLNIIASMQATHATSDKNMAQARLGDQRILGAYAWRTLLSKNVIIAAGSDFPVESPNPFYGLHAAITRQDHQNKPDNGWFPNEKMTRIEAFRTFTIDAAYAGHQEKLIGSLAKGKKADFILIENNLFSEPETDIWKNEVVSTWVNGKQVYSNDLDKGNLN